MTSIISPADLDQTLINDTDIEALNLLINEQVKEQSKLNPLSATFRVEFPESLPTAVAEMLCRQCITVGWAEASVRYQGSTCTSILTMSRNVYATSTGPGGRD